MLKLMRQEAKQLRWILVLIVVSFLATIFVSWGMGGASVVGGAGISPWAARVDGEEISREDFLGALQRQDQMLRELLGAGYQPGMYNAEAVLDSLIDRKVLELEAGRLGLEATDAEIVDMIRSQPGFHDAAGRFDPERYRNYLRNSRTSPAEFERAVAEDVIVSKMGQLLESAARVPDDAVREAWMAENASADIEYVLFPVDDMLASVAEPGEEELRAWHAAHADDYDAGPARRVQWVEFDRAPFQARLEDEAQMRAFYDENVELAYTIGPAQRRARHVLIRVPEGASDAARQAAREKAQGIADQARAGADFAALAREHSDDEQTRESGGDTGPFFTGAHDPAFDAAAFEMEDGEIRGPIETAEGYEVLLLTKGEGSQARPFEEVRDLVSRGLYATEANASVEEALAKFREAQAGGASFEDAARAAGAEPTGPAWIHRGDTLPGLGEDPALVERIFALEPGEVGDAMPSEGGQVVLNVLESRESSPRSFEEAREDVVADVKREKAMAAARADAEAMRERVIAGADLLAEAGTRGVSTAQAVNPGRLVPGLALAPRLNEAIFETPEGGIGPVRDTPKGPVVFRVTSLTGFDPQRFEEEAPAMRRRLEDQAAQAVRRASQAKLREAYEIEINAAVVDPYRSPVGM